MLRRTADILCCRVGGGCVPGSQDVSSSTQTDHVDGTTAGEGSGGGSGSGGGGGGGRLRRRQHGLASMAAAANLDVTSTTLSPADLLYPRRSSLSGESTGKSHLYNANVSK